MEQTHQELDCANYTNSSRRPLVIGKLENVNLPAVATMPQIGVGATCFGLLLATWRLWGPVVPGSLDFVVLVVAPIAAAARVIRTTFEGRSLTKTIAGYIRLFTRRRLWANDRLASSEVERIAMALPAVVEVEQ